ncbi:MAG: DUF3008 domain-containing protein [Gammaproteobacteria bacterium]|nr:DUF3008 domain-containing protein [Gammaproteobacteria bacterium]
MRITLSQIKQAVREAITEIRSERQLSEKAVSKAQQRFFGMVSQCQEPGGKCPSEKVSKAAETISKKEASKFAKTKHKNLPEKKKKK